MANQMEERVRVGGHIRELLGQLGRDEPDVEAEVLARAVRRAILRMIAKKRLPAAYLDALFAWGIENGRRTGVRRIERGLLNGRSYAGAPESSTPIVRSRERPIPGLEAPHDTLASRERIRRLAGLAGERFKIGGMWVAYGRATLSQLAARRAELERTRDGCNRSIALVDEIVEFIKDEGAATLNEALAAQDGVSP